MTSLWRALSEVGRKPAAARGEGPAQVVELDPTILAEGGLHETPAGWRKRLEQQGLHQRKLKGLPGNDALLDVLRARRDAVWRKLGWRWFGGGWAAGAVLGFVLAMVAEDAALGLVFALQYGFFFGGVGFLIGRRRYDKHRRKVLSQSDTALAAVDSYLQEDWVDALKALALAPCAARGGGLVVDGTTPARRSLGAWADELHRLQERCQAWQQDAEAGLGMVGELGALGGEKARAARAELHALRASAERLEAEVGPLLDKVAWTIRELKELPESLRTEPTAQRQERDLRPLFEELAEVDGRSAELELAFGSLGAPGR